MKFIHLIIKHIIKMNQIKIKFLQWTVKKEYLKT